MNFLKIAHEKWDNKYAYALKSWDDNWSELSTFFKYPNEIRKIIYTTNTIESFNSRLRKVTKTKNSFPSDMALLKILYLVTKKHCQKMEKTYSKLANYTNST